MAKDYDIQQAFQVIEEQMIESMIRNMKHHIITEKSEGLNYAQWQAEELKSLAEFRARNKQMFNGYFSTINKEIETALKMAYEKGGMDQEIAILEALKKGYHPPMVGSIGTTTGEFFKINDRKINALINATVNDIKKGELAMLRMANDEYRKTIFNAHVYLQTGNGTLEQAVDMATKDFLSRGINCIEYSNGARVPIDSYAKMALRTASTRAYLQGESAKRDEWGINTVLVNRRGVACPKCIQWVGRVYYDDVYGSVPVTDDKYPLLSQAIAGGLYHPNCKDSHTTYFEGINDVPKPMTQAQKAEANRVYALEQRQRGIERNIRKYKRLTACSLDPENVAKYQERADYWQAYNKQFVKANGDVLKRRYENEDIHGITSFTAPPNILSQAQQAEQAAKAALKAAEEAQKAAEQAVIDYKSTSLYSDIYEEAPPEEVLKYGKLQKKAKQIDGADLAINYKQSLENKYGYNFELSATKEELDTLTDIITTELEPEDVAKYAEYEKAITDAKDELNNYIDIQKQTIGDDWNIDLTFTDAKYLNKLEKKAHVDPMEIIPLPKIPTNKQTNSYKLSAYKHKMFDKYGYGYKHQLTAYETNKLQSLNDLAKSDPSGITLTAAQKLKKQKAEIQEHIIETQYDIDSFPKKEYNGIWKDPVTVKDYSSKKSSIAAKKQYFENKLYAATDPADIQKWQNLIDQVDEYEQQGAIYAGYENNLQDFQNQLAALGKKKKSPTNTVDVNFDFADAYSKERKDNAKWFRSPRDADRYFDPPAVKVHNDATRAEHKGFYTYTQGSGGHNRPLAGFEKPWSRSGTGWEEQFYKGSKNVWIDFEGKGADIRGLTDLIDKSTYDADVWLQSGQDYKTLEGFLKIPYGSLNKMTEQEMQKFVGRENKIYNFISCAVNKGGGSIFNSKPMKLNVYAPKGTKMLYASSGGAFGKRENEMILQRGGSYQITRIYYGKDYTDGGGIKLFVDMEVHPEKGYDLFQQDPNEWTGSKRNYRD